MPSTVSVKQAAQCLGVSVACVYSKISNGNLPVIFVGRQCRIPAEALRAYARHRQHGFYGCRVFRRIRQMEEADANLPNGCLVKERKEKQQRT